LTLSGKIMEGKFPKRASNLVVDWIALHETELNQNWNRARNGEPLIQIAPLE